MTKCIVKKQHLPKRCEICHKADFFDAAINNCSLCNSIELTTEQISSNININTIMPQFLNSLLRQTKTNETNTYIKIISILILSITSYHLTFFISIFVNAIRGSIEGFLNPEGGEFFYGIITNVDFYIAALLYACFIFTIWGYFKYKAQHNDNI